MPQSGVARTDSPTVAPPPPPPRPPFLPQVYQSVHDAFVRLETRGGHVYNRREEDVEQDGRERAPLTKALFHNEPPRAHPVVEPHACSHAIVEMMNGRDHIMWHAKTGEYCPEEGSINGVVSFLVRSIKHTCSGIRFFRASSCNRRITNIISVVERFGRKPPCSSGRIPTCSQYFAAAASDDFQQYLAGVHYQRDVPVVTALCPSFFSWRTMLMAHISTAATPRPPSK